MSFSLLFSFLIFLPFSVASPASQNPTVGKQCKAAPGTAEWPSAVDWARLNDTVKGRLLKPDPPAAACHKGHEAYSWTQCKKLNLGWMFSGWHAEHPTSGMWQNYNNHSCPPDGTGTCTNNGYPQYVVEARESADVKAAVDFARTRNIRLNIKSSGHDFLGRSTQPNSLSIWTHRLKSIEWFQSSYTPKGCSFSIDGTAMKVGSGSQWRDLNAAAEERDVSLVSGAFDTVSVGGYLANGGHGGLSAMYGLGADMVMEIELVNAAGEIITANECQNQDYFWAMRGGGGSTYGVVLTYTLQTIPSRPAAQYYTLLSGWEELVHIHRQWPKIAMRGGSGYIVGYPGTQGLLGTVALRVTLPNSTWTELRAIMNPVMEGLEGWMNIIHGSGNDEPVENKRVYQGKSVSEIRGNYTQFKSWSEVEPTLSPHGELAQRQNVGPSPKLTDLSVWDVFPGMGENKIIASWLYSSEDVQSPKLKAALQGALSDPDMVYLNDATMGIGTHKPPFIRGGGNAVNPAFRTAVMRPAAELHWSGTDPNLHAKKRQQAAAAGASLRSVNPQGGTYANEADPETPDWQHAFWGSNYERLLTIKKQVDPTGVFYCRACVGSELFEDKAGVLCRL